MSTRPDGDSPGVQPPGYGVRSVSCVECRRLKRKCSRAYPCQACSRYGKECIFRDGGRYNKQSYESLIERISQLEDMLRSAEKGESQSQLRENELRPADRSVHLSDHLPDHLSEAEPGRHVTTETSHRAIASCEESITLLGRPGSIHSATMNLESANGPTDDDDASAPRQAPEIDLTSGWPHHDIQRSNATSEDTFPSGMSVPLVGSTMNAQDIPLTAATGKAGTCGRRAVTAPTSDVLEAQPSTSVGYEWDEQWSPHSHKDHDGYASLSIDAEGKGYLGFASGSTVLRILQICAKSTSLTALVSAPPSTTEMPNKVTLSDSDVSACLNAYFEYYHPQYPILHEPTFRAQWMELIPHPLTRDWDLLKDSVLGIGAFCDDKPPALTDHFFESAIGRITAAHLETGTLTLVQAYCLLSVLSQKRNKPNASTVYLGIAIRMAVSLGMHLELPFWKIPPFEAETRRRIWWAAICFDAGSSITMGRPILEPVFQSGEDVYMIRNIHDRSLTPVTRQSPPETDSPTIYSALRYNSSFHAHTNALYLRIMASPPPSPCETISIDDDIKQWYGTVPAYFHPTSRSDSPHWLILGQYKMFWRYSNLRMILHRRSFLERALKGSPLWQLSADFDDGEQAKSCMLCISTAADTVTSIAKFFETRAHPSRLEQWYALHYLLHAAFITLIALHSDPRSDREHSWRDTTTLACSILELYHQDPKAARCLDIIKALTPVPASTQWTSPNGLQDADMWFSETLTSIPGWDDIPGGTGFSGQHILPSADLGSLSALWYGQQ